MINYILGITLIGSIFLRIGKIYFGNTLYIIILTPLFVMIILKLFSLKKISLNINKIDFTILLFLIFLLLNLFISSIRGSFQSQFIFVFYVIIPIIIYFYIRSINYSLESFSKIMFIFTFTYASYVLLEFTLYYIYPETQYYITAYLRDVVQNNNFYPPHVNYPIIGKATKPWGPMIDTSGTGVFLVVLFAFIFDTQKYVNKNFAILTIIISIIAIFFSGSKSAYLIFLLYIVIKNIFLNDKKITLSKLINRVILITIVVIFIILYFTFFFKDGLLSWYIFAMVIDPIEKLYQGFFLNGVYTIIGSGQENGHYIIYGIAEVDLFNAIFRYGLISITLLLSLITYIIITSRKKYKEFSLLYVMFLLSMVHYQVILKFPASMILLMSLAVFVNTIKNRKLTYA